MNTLNKASIRPRASQPYLKILASFSIFSSLVISLYSSIIFSSSVSFALCTSDFSFTKVEVNSLKQNASKLKWSKVLYDLSSSLAWVPDAYYSLAYLYGSLWHATFRSLERFQGQLSFKTAVLASLRVLWMSFMRWANYFMCLSIHKNANRFPLLLNEYVQYFIYIRYFTFCQLQCVASHQYNCQNTVCGWFVLGMRTYCSWTLSFRKERCVTKWKSWIRRGQRFSFVPLLGHEGCGGGGREGKNMTSFLIASYFQKYRFHAKREHGWNSLRAASQGDY